MSEYPGDARYAATAERTRDEHRTFDLRERIDSMINTCQDVRREGAQPRVHGNGFVQLDITARHRLHIWGDPRIPRQLIPAQIHDHVFGFTSRVLLGQLVHRRMFVYEDKTFGEGRIHGSLGAPYRRYQAVVTHGADTALVQQPGRWGAAIMEERLFRAGDVYTFAAGAFHETLAPWLCVTVIEKDGPTLEQGGPAPSVLVPDGVAPDPSFDRYTAAPDDLLWAVIFGALVSKVGAHGRRT